VPFFDGHELVVFPLLDDFPLLEDDDDVGGPDSGEPEKKEGGSEGGREGGKEGEREGEFWSCSTIFPFWTTTITSAVRIVERLRRGGREGGEGGKTGLEKRSMG